MDILLEPLEMKRYSSWYSFNESACGRNIFNFFIK